MKNAKIEFSVDRLLTGAEELVAYKAGKMKLRTWSIDPKTGERQMAICTGKRGTPKIITKSAPLSAEKIRQIRTKLGMSQSVFAVMLNVPNSTARAWERGVRRPAGAAQRLLQIADRVPEVLKEFV
jgi:putative transcriptional regulator